MFENPDVSGLLSLHQWKMPLMKGIISGHLQGSIAKFKMTERGLLTSMASVYLKLRIKNKMRKGNHLYEIEVREVANEMKRIKLLYKGFSEDTDQMSGVTMVLYLTSNDCTSLE